MDPDPKTYKNVVTPKKHLQLFGELLFSEQFSDFKFVFPEDKATLPAHKCVLSAVSPYFKKAFSGEWKEENEAQPVHSLPVMKGILTFIYTGCVDVVESLWKEDQHMWDAALKASDYYQLSTLKDYLSGYMKNNLSLENLKACLVAAHLHGLSDLKTGCFSLIRNNKEAIYADPKASIATISLEHPDLWLEVVECTKKSSTEQPRKRRKVRIVEGDFSHYTQRRVAERRAAERRAAYVRQRYQEH